LHNQGKLAHFENGCLSNFMQKIIQAVTSLQGTDRQSLMKLIAKV